MCRAFSFYAARINGDIKLWWSETTDSHAEIATQHRLRDIGLVSLYAGEFYPGDDAPQPDPATWTLRWDSDATNSSREEPNAEDAAEIRRQVEQIVRRFVQVDPLAEQTVTTRGWAWAGTQTVNGGDGRAYDHATQTVNGGVGRAYNNATQTANGGKGVAYNNATQTANGGKGVACDHATQTVNGGVGRAYNNATQTVNGGKGVVYNNATQTVNGGEGVAYNNATQTVNLPTATTAGKR